MDSNSDYEAHEMVFQNKQVYYLIKQFNKTLTPLFEIIEDPFCDKAKPNSKCRKNEKWCWKILFRLSYIFWELEKFGKIKIEYFYDDAFEKAFPNIMHMYDEQKDLYRTCPFDVNGTLDMTNISCTDGYLYELSRDLRNLGVSTNYL